MPNFKSWNNNNIVIIYIIRRLPLRAMCIADGSPFQSSLHPTWMQRFKDSVRLNICIQALNNIILTDVTSHHLTQFPNSVQHLAYIGCQSHSFKKNSTYTCRMQITDKMNFLPHQAGSRQTAFLKINPSIRRSQIRSSIKTLTFHWLCHQLYCFSDIRATNNDLDHILLYIYILFILNRGNFHPKER